MLLAAAWWKAAVEGRGHSSSVVWDDYLFLTTSLEGEPAPGNKPPVHPDFNRIPGYVHPDSVGADRKHALKVLAFDTRNGQLRWSRTAYDGVMYDDAIARTPMRRPRR